MSGWAIFAALVALLAVQIWTADSYYSGFDACLALQHLQERP